MNRERIAILANGILASIIGIAPVLLIISAAVNKGLTETQTTSWVFGSYVIAGLIGICLSVWKRMPICGSHSVPAAVLLGGALMSFTLEEAAGSYLIAGLLMLILGLSDGFRKMVALLPIEIVMAMFAGTMMKYAVGIAALTVEHAAIGVPCLIGFLFVYLFLRPFPPALGAIALGSLACWVTGEFSRLQTGSFVLPQLLMPEFSWQGAISLTFPMVVLILGTEGVQGVTGLQMGGYKPPVNQMVIVSGIGTMLSSFFGAHSANTAGIMTSVCASPDVGRQSERYKASLISGAIMLGFGVFAGFFIPVVMSFPRHVLDLFTGFAILPVLMQALSMSFSGKHISLASFSAFVVALSGVTMFQINAPLWSLLIGSAMMAVERNLRRSEAKEDN